MVIDDGPLGITCARIGHMPSKMLIQVANHFARRQHLQEQIIHCGLQLKVETTEVVRHVRKLRDRFVGGVPFGMAH